MEPDSDDSAAADPAAESPAAAERRRLVDLTRPEKGLPERRDLRRSQRPPTGSSPHDDAGRTADSGADPAPQGEEPS